MKPIQSVERALKILELLDGVESGRALGVLELGQRLGLKPPTVHNFLQTLLALGYVEQDSVTSKYRLGERTRFLGWNGGMKNRLADCARSAAQKLSARFNEHVLLMVADRNLRVALLVLHGSQTLSVRLDTRADSKFYSSGTGRCLLSAMTEAELADLVKVIGLPHAREWAGVTTRKQLQAELAKIRAAGHSIYLNEGVAGLGASIHVPEQQVNAALGLFMPEFRFQGELRAQIIQGLKAAAWEIAGEIRRRAPAVGGAKHA